MTPLKIAEKSILCPFMPPHREIQCYKSGKAQQGLGISEAIAAYSASSS